MSLLPSVQRLPLDQIIQGDCVDVLASLPDKCVDMIFADPPYNLQLQNELRRPNTTIVDAVDDGWDRFPSLAAYDLFTTAWLGACRRVLKDTGTIWVIGTYHNIYRVGAILQNLGYWFLNDIVWIKANPMPNFRGVRFTNAHETLLWCTKASEQKQYTFNYQTLKGMNEDKQMRSDWEIPLCTGAERLRVDGVKVHATQKPEALLYRVLMASTRPGDVVLDPFFGSGTTGAVAKKLRRHYVGIEREEAYIHAAQARIEAVRPAPDDATVGRDERSRRGRRIPFAALLENGLLLPGQPLFYHRSLDHVVTVQADGTLKTSTDERGSIHTIGALVGQSASCNGWDCWYVQSPDGQFVVIDELRARLRSPRD